MFFPLHDDNPTRRTPVVTFGLIAINVVVFIWMLTLPPERQQSLFLNRGFIPARLGQLVDPDPILVPVRLQAVNPMTGERGIIEHRVEMPPAPRQTMLSLLTCMFLHGGWLHLIGNMWFLWVFGNNVEDRLGPLPFLAFYLFGGIAATFCHWLTGPSSTVPVVGASGAIAAVLGAYAITWPWARVHTLVFLVIFFTIIDVPALVVLGFWFAMQLLDAVNAIGRIDLNGGVALWAHIGGFVAGLALMPTVRNWFGTSQFHGPSRAA